MTKIWTPLQKNGCTDESQSIGRRPILMTIRLVFIKTIQVYYELLKCIFQNGRKWSKISQDLYLNSKHGLPSGKLQDRKIVPEAASDYTIVHLSRYFTRFLIPFHRVKVSSGEDNNIIIICGHSKLKRIADRFAILYSPSLHITQRRQ